MTLASGVSLGPYEILAPLGAGGMGEVYRARDTKLGREVAIKALPEAFSRDPERLARFEREAQVLASLNHPNIAAIYGLEESDGHRFLVLELVPGEILAGPVPVEEALAIARQIAEALEAAHEKGVVHRDLKPANVKITPEGRVKVLDFGLALLGEGSQGSGTETESALLTRDGAILGTAAYMSPEQARGRRVDRRADIWAFGGVLYELLTGKQAFGGETVSDTLAAILGREPDWEALPAATPQRLRDLLRRCFQRDLNRRQQHMGDARIEIEEILAGPAAPLAAAPAGVPSRRREVLAWGTAAVLAVGLAVTYSRRPPAEETAAVRFSIPPPEKSTFLASHSISADGRLLAFRAIGPDGQTRIHVRPLDSLAARPLPGTEGAIYTFWSADSRFIGFAAQGKLKKIDVAGGPAQTIADGLGAGGSAWNRDGVIVTSRSLADVLYRVPAAGGTPTALTELDRARSETGHMHPHFLPDGRHFLYLATSSQPENTALYAASLDSPKTPKRILNVASHAMYSAPGYLVFAREGTLLAQRFDADRLEASGEVVALADQIGQSSPPSLKLFSVSANGVLTYRTGSALVTQLAWFDRAGKPLGAVGSPAAYSNPKLSPDQKRLVVELVDSQTSTPDLWLIDLVRGGSSRFTFDPAADAFPVWSPDGTRIAFGASREGPMQVYQKLSSGAGDEELLLKSGETKHPTDWTSDGRFLLYSTLGGDVWLLPLSGDRKPVPFLRTPFLEYWARFSPDGRWIAYQSNASGRQEVYVQPFRESSGGSGGGIWQVSTNGGADPQWGRNGKELFYMAPDRRLMAVEVKAGATFEAGSPRPLFTVRALAASPVFSSVLPSSTYAVGADGQRFLVNTPVEDTAAPPIQVVVNWTSGLRK